MPPQQQCTSLELAKEQTYKALLNNLINKIVDSNKDQLLEQTGDNEWSLVREPELTDLLPLLGNNWLKPYATQFAVNKEILTIWNVNDLDDETLPEPAPIKIDYNLRLPLTKQSQEVLQALINLIELK